MTPYSRFTFSHSSLPGGSLVVENPIGWDTAVISLERHKEYHSLVEEFKGNFMWYGLGMSTLKQIEADYGFNAIVGLTIDISFKSGVFTNLFTGQIKVAQLEEIMIADREHYKMTAPIIRDDFWTKFINRSESQVNLQAAVDLDGNARTVINKIVLPMPSQKIRQNTNLFTATPILLGTLYDGSFSDPDFQKDIDEDWYVQFGFPNPILDEVETNHGIYSSPTRTVRPSALYTVKHTGDYTFDIQIALTEGFYSTASGGLHEYIDMKGLSSFSGSGALDIKVYIQINEETPIEFTVSDHSAAASGGSSSANDYWTEYNYADTLSLNAGDQIRIYGQKVTSGAFGYGNSGSKLVEQVHQLGLDSANNIQFSGGISTLQFNGVTESYLKITANTVFDDTETDAYLIKDAAESIVSKLVGQNAAVKSDYLDTCKGYNAIFRGKHLRGYDFATKQFSMSWVEWWRGANPLLFLGAGYTSVLGVKKIEIEERAYFYDPVPAVNISNVNKLVRRYDLEKIYKSIEIGFKKWSSEAASGIDDPQTKRFYNTDFNSVGVKESILCEWIAASLAIEKARRDRVIAGEDKPNDEEIMVVALVEDGSDWLPEFGTAFNAITNLLNSDFRINVRHSATRLFKRAQSWFNGCMVYSDTGTFTFNRGEGNYEMTSQLEESDCEAVSGTEPIIDEGGDIAADTSDIIFVPRIYEAESVPMSFETYQQIVANKNKALGISRTDTGHVPMHILDLGFTIFKSESSLLLLQATEDGL